METKGEKLNNHIAIQAINNNKIYVYTVTDLNGQTTNKGWLKVGQTIRLSDDRVREQTHTAGLTPRILFETRAQDINGNVFTDHDIHTVLKNKSLVNKEGTEWFTNISNNEEDLLSIIKTVINNRIKCHADFSQLKDQPTEFKLRPNQHDAVEKTIERWKIAANTTDDSKSVRQFLWNAKPRFGKTLSAYSFAQRIRAKKILIITQRTSISDSWHKDYYDWIKDNTDYKFGSSKENILKSDGRILHTAISKSNSENLVKNPEEKLIFYISFSDIKGKTKNEFKSNNKWLFQTDWDLFIVDETHEGSDTDKAVEVFDNLKTRFTLHLSGTPFKKIARKAFNAKNTYTWSYSDEQEYKNNWDYTTGENPYAEMPRLSIFTYQMSQTLRQIAQSDEFSFDFAEFFKNDGSKFIHESEINQFLDNLSAQHTSDVRDNSAQYYPFADSTTREQLRHTFWLLPQKGGVKMCELLKSHLKHHPYFKDYRVIMAAGDGDEDRLKSDKALNEVHDAIGEKPWQTKTITLSCGQLTTGITVAPWTAVLMLNNLTSPALYLQAAFRAQNPWRYEVNGEINNKSDCFVFDFAPDRILKIVDEYANLDVERHIDLERKNNIKKLINYLSVLSLDQTGQMKYLDAADVLELPHYFDAKDIVDNGFMSNKLFNIGNIFSLPREKREKAVAILNQLQSVKNKKIKKDTKEVGEDEIQLPENVTLSESPLGERQYEIISTDKNGNEQVSIIPESKIEAEIKNVENPELKKALDEIKKEKPKIQSEEDKQRDRLRGFSRTIPMFLMAYGKNTTNLSNFDEFVNAQVFEELAGITREDFRLLRDECQFFNESRFNSAIKEFIERKNSLKDYYKNESGDDIFNYIPPQNTNQIFTPKKVVNMQLDMMEQNDPTIFKNPNNKLFDPYMKSGQYITEIAKRLYKNSKDKNIERILTTQLFGLSPTKVLTDITHEHIFGFADLHEKKKYKNNFIELDLLGKDVNGSVIIKKVGGLQNVIEELWGSEMKFTAIVGNPPYQTEATQQIFVEFYISARQIGQSVCMIFPTNWQKPKNANGLSRMNNIEIKHDRQIVNIDNRHNAFAGVPGAEWTNIIQWRKGFDNKLGGKQRVLTNGKDEKIVKLPTEKSDLEKPKAIVELSNLVMSSKDFNSVQSITSVLKPYGLRTDVIKKPSKYGLPPISDIRRSNDDIEILAGGSRGGGNRIKKYVSSDYPFPIKTKALEKYKVAVPYAWGNMSENTGLGGAFSDIIVVGPHVAMTETFLESGCFDDFDTAKKHAKYLMTQFTRSLIYLNKFSKHTTTAWGAVPIQNYIEPWWDKSISEIDCELMKKYSIPRHIQDFVFSNIQKKTEKNIVTSLD